MKILLTDCITVHNNYDVSLEVFKSFGNTVEYNNISREELLREVTDTDMIICNKTVIDREVMDNAPKLKYIGLFATGYNNIDIPAAKEKGIVVSNAGSYSTNAVAQQVIAYILMHYTKAAEYNEYVKQGNWIGHYVFCPLVFTGDEVYGKTLGIIGYGSIGKAVKRAAEGLGMKVIVNTRTVREDGETVFVDRDTLFRESDIVSLHCPLNEESRDMINEESLKQFKDGAFLINTARGGVVDEYAVAAALESGKLSGAAVDVLKQEPMQKDCPLRNAKNIIITPHTAWAPKTTRERLINIVADNIRAFLEGKPQNNVAK